VHSIQENFAYVIPSLLTGGAELQTINQLNYLWSKGIRNFYCIILSRQASNLEKLKMDPEKIKIFEKYDEIKLSPASIRQSLNLAKDLAKFLKDNNIHNVLAILPYAHFCCRLAKLFLIRSHKIKLSVYYRNVYYSLFPLNTFSKRLFNKMDSILAYFLDNKSLFISKAVFKDVSSHFFVRHHLILPNSLPLVEVGADLALQYLNKEKINLQGRFVVLFPGRLTRQKGHVFLIECMRRFITQYEKPEREVLILLAGDGPEKNQILTLIDRYDLKERFKLTGNIDNELLLSLHKLSDVVVIPSVNEGFGNVCIEGLMQKSVLLVADIGGLSEIIEDRVNGIKFKALDEDDFIEKFRTIYDGEKDILDRKIIFQSFVDNYTIDKQIPKIIAHCSIKTDTVM